MGQAEGVEEGLGLAQVGQHLGVTQVGMHVHHADLAAKEGAGFSALEQLLRPAAIRQRAVEQTGAVGAAQVGADQGQMGLGLLNAEHVFEHRVHHRQQAVVHAGQGVAGVQQQLRWRVLGEQRIAGDHAVLHQQALEVGAHGQRLGLQRRGVCSAAELAQRAGQLRQHLGMQGDRPGAAQALAQGRVGRLQRVVPVAVSISDQSRA